MKNMKKIISNILFRLKEGSLAKKKNSVSRTVVYKTFEDIKTGLVFWSADFEPQGVLKKISGAVGIKFDKLCVVSKEQEIPQNIDAVILKNEELGFGGKIKNDQLHAIMAKRYDLLIDLTTDSSVMIQYVLTNSNACCIASMKKVDSVADIVIGDAKDAEELIDKLMELLSKMKKL